MILNESISDTLIVYLILKKLTVPFKEWKAYELGIIDEKGNKLRDPKTPEEKKEWNILTIFIWNIKKLIQKFIGKSKLAAYLSAAYLLKDSFKIIYVSNKNLLTETDMEIINSITAIEKIALVETMNKIKNKQSIIITENKLKNNSIDIDTRLMELFIEFYKLFEKSGDETMIKIKEIINEILEENIGNNYATIGPITSDDVFDPKYLNDPFVYSFNKNPKQAQKDIQKFDKANKNKDPFNNTEKIYQRFDVDKTTNFEDLFKKMEELEIQYDDVLKNLPVFNVNSQDEFDSFGSGEKIYFRWMQHTTNENIRKFGRNFPKMPFFIHYNGLYKLIQRKK